MAHTTRLKHSSLHFQQNWADSRAVWEQPRSLKEPPQCPRWSSVHRPDEVQRRRPQAPSPKPRTAAPHSAGTAACHCQNLTGISSQKIIKSILRVHFKVLTPVGLRAAHPVFSKQGWGCRVLESVHNTRKEHTEPREDTRHSAPRARSTHTRTRMHVCTRIFHKNISHCALEWTKRFKNTDLT